MAEQYGVSYPRHPHGPYWVCRYYEQWGLNYVSDVSWHWTRIGARLTAWRMNRRLGRVR